MAATIFYGIWLRGQGWLKRNGEYIAFDNLQVAQQTKKRIGKIATVYYIDGALADLEVYFLEMEKSKVVGIRQLLRGWFAKIKAIK